MQNHLNEAAFVTVRNSSSRLPKKSLKNIKNNVRSIDIVIQRGKQTNLPLILTTSTAESDTVFEEISKEHKIEIFRGALLNKIKRWYDCFMKYDLEYVLLLDGDDLCHDYKIGKKAINELKKTGADMIMNPPDIVTGFFTSAISLNGIQKLFNVVKNENTNTDVITKFIEKANLNVKIIDLEPYQRNKNIRLTLDYEEDLEFFRRLYEKIDILETGNKIIDFLNANPQIIDINFHRQKDFLANQAQFNEGVK